MDRVQAEGLHREVGESKQASGCSSHGGRKAPADEEDVDVEEVARACGVRTALSCYLEFLRRSCRGSLFRGGQKVLVVLSQFSFPLPCTLTYSVSVIGV